MSDEPAEIPEGQENNSLENSLEKAGFAYHPPGDLPIFKLLSEYRLLLGEHLSLLTGRNPKRLHGRLLQLVANGYINRKKHVQKFVYYIGKRALSHLVGEGIADPDLLVKRRRTHEVKNLDHELMITEFHITLYLATRGTDLELVDWRQGQGIHDRVVIGGKEYPFTPDAFFKLEDSGQPAGTVGRAFFLEADRSSETWPKQFRDKVLASWYYGKNRLHEEKFGVKSFRVLTLTVSEARAQELCTKTRALLSEERAWKHYFFSSVRNFSLQNPSSVLQSVYLRPGKSERYPLMPEPKPSQPEASVL